MELRSPTAAVAAALITGCDTTSGGTQHHDVRLRLSKAGAGVLLLLPDAAELSACRCGKVDG